MSGYADGRFAMVAIGLAEAFGSTPLIAPADQTPYDDLGLGDRTLRYFALRSAPLGQVPAEVVTSTFFGFHPSKVARYIPAAWESTTPAAALEARQVVADETLRALLGDWVGSEQARTAAALARTAAEHCEGPGRPLFAATAALPWPDADQPHLVLWHAFTLLREFRGDSHIAVLVANDVDACECHLLLAAAAVGGCECHRAFNAYGLTVDIDTPPDQRVGADREWPVEDRRQALRRLCDRGLLREDRTITPAGLDFHVMLERATDTASSSRWERTRPEGADQLAELVEEPARVLRSGWNLSAVREPQAD